MSFNLGGIFRSFGGIIPGFIKGQQQAIADNWLDLKNSEAVRDAQLQNMYNENAMGARLQMAKDNAIINNYQRHAAGLDLGYKYMQWPLATWQIGQQTAWAPVMGDLRRQMAMRQAAMAMNPRAQAQAGQQGGALQQAMLGGLGGGWQYGLGGGYGGYGGYGLGSYGRMPSRLF